MRQKTVNLKVKTSFNSENEMNFRLTGITEKEIAALISEFKPETYYNYEGDYKAYYMYPGLEVLIYLLEKFNAIFLQDYKYLLYPTTEVFPYLLSDNRVVVITGGGASFFKSEKEFLKVNLTNLNLLSKRTLASKDYPISRIEYLPGNKLIFFHQINPIIGNIFKNLYDQLDKKEYPHVKFESKLYKISDGKIYQHYLNNNAHFVYRIEDFESLHQKQKIVIRLANAQRNGKISQYGFSEPTMCGRNFYNDQFVANIDNLINKLKAKLALVDENLEYTRKELIKIENRIFSNLITDQYANELFLPVLAYVGNYCVENFNAEWSLEYDKTFDSWVPDIIIGNPIRIYDKVLIMFDPNFTYVSFENKLSNYLSGLLNKL